MHFLTLLITHLILIFVHITTSNMVKCLIIFVYWWMIVHAIIIIFITFLIIIPIFVVEFSLNNFLNLLLFFFVISSMVWWRRFLSIILCICITLQILFILSICAPSNFYLYLWQVWLLCFAFQLWTSLIFCRMFDLKQFRIT